MGAAYSMDTTLALGLPMVMSRAVMVSLPITRSAAVAVSPEPLRKYQAPPATSAATSPSTIQPLRDMQRLPFEPSFFAELSAQRNLMIGAQAIACAQEHPASLFGT